MAVLAIRLRRKSFPVLDGTVWFEASTTWLRAATTQDPILYTDVPGGITIVVS